MAEVLTPMERLRRSVDASTINVKKAHIFAVGWWLRDKHKFRKYPDAYKAAKDNIGLKSLIFNVPRWPKKFERGPLQQEMQMFYMLMEQSLCNEEWRVSNLVGQLTFVNSWYYHKYVEMHICHDLWWDCATDLDQMSKQPVSRDSRALACKVFDDEDFGDPLAFLLDSLMDTGHDFEVDHLRTDKHTPACPVLRKIAGIK